MAVIGVLVSHFVFVTVRRLGRQQPWSLFIGGFAAGWSSVFLASLACALELAVSGTSPANIAVPAMGGIHALIGFGEGLITLGALSFLYASRRDLVTAQPAKAKDGIGVWTIGLGIALVLAVISPLASAHPDGLEWVAQQKGFLAAARSPLFHLIPNYLFPGVSNQALATILASLVGTLLVFAVALSVSHLRRSRRDTA
jgi:cobalt/nickel transport system permease protein